MCTLRLTSSSRAALDEAANRTERSLAWLVGEAVTDAAAAIVAADNGSATVAVLEDYLAAPPRSDMARTTVTLAEHTEQLAARIAQLYHRILGHPVSTSAVLRAAWMRWSAAGAEQVIADIGAVRPAGLPAVVASSGRTA